MEKKYKLHFPCQEYGFIEIEGEGTVQDAVDEYEEFKRAWNSEGLSATEWAQFRKKVVSNESFTPEMQETLEKCNKSQKEFVNQFKLACRSLKTN